MGFRNLMKRQSHLEVIVLLAMGVSPKVLISKGYSRASVYNYNKKIPMMRKKLDELITEKL